MTTEQIPVTIIEEKPTGYLVKLVETEVEIVVPKKVFIRRTEAGIYDVKNRNFLTKAI